LPDLQFRSIKYRNEEYANNSVKIRYIGAPAAGDPIRLLRDRGEKSPPLLVIIYSGYLQPESQEVFTDLLGSLNIKALIIIGQLQE
jgi:hypothetical protein